MEAGYKTEESLQDTITCNPRSVVGTEESFEIYPNPVVSFSFKALKSASSRMPSFDVRQSLFGFVRVLSTKLQNLHLRGSDGGGTS